MSKKILFILSEYGYWGEELLGPLVACDKQGYEAVFATPTGKRPTALPPSLDPGYVDPPLGRSVTTPEVAVAARQLADSA
ncbi:MAG: type 1 glutamine amidotransferase domain-containing protein, partial [Umezawaea sp.]